MSSLPGISDMYILLRIMLEALIHHLNSIYYGERCWNHKRTWFVCTKLICRHRMLLDLIPGLVSLHCWKQKGRSCHIDQRLNGLSVDVIFKRSGRQTYQNKLCFTSHQLYYSPNSHQIAFIKKLFFKQRRLGQMCKTLLALRHGASIRQLLAAA